jgi:hypothetical protein
VQLTIHGEEFTPTYCIGAVGWNKLLSVHALYVFHISSISIIHVGLVIQIDLFLIHEDILAFPKLWGSPLPPFCNA